MIILINIYASEVILLVRADANTPYTLEAVSINQISTGTHLILSEELALNQTNGSNFAIVFATGNIVQPI